MNGDDPSTDLAAVLFDRQIKDYVFGGHRPSDRPVLVLLGGQPGSGKSHAMAGQRRLRAAEGLVGLTGDALRPFHPDYQSLRDDPFSLPSAVAPMTAEWVRRAIDHALAGRYSLLLEGTFRDADVVVDTVRRFAAAGYRTEVVVLAVREERSRLDSLLRFVNPGGASPGRWTSSTAHDTAYERLPETVRRLDDVAELDRVALWTRSGEVYANERGPSRAWMHPGRAHDVLVELRDLPFVAVEAQAWLEMYRRVMADTLRQPAVDARVVAVCAALHVDADRVADMAHPDPDDAHRRLHALAQREFAAALADHGGAAIGGGEALHTSRVARSFPPVTRADPRGRPSRPPDAGGSDQGPTQQRRPRGR